MGNLPLAVISGVDLHWSQMVILLVGITVLIIALNSKSANAFLVLLGSILWLTIFNSLTYSQKSNYSALVFYNICAEMAIAQIDQSKVILYSSLDSISHQTLQYSVLPDLRQYTTEKDIHFQGMENEERQNRIIETGTYKILIVEKKMDDIPSELDFVLWRKNNYTDIQN